MVTSKYENQFLAIMKESLIINSRADKFINDVNKRIELIGKICIRISTIRHVSISDAESYIDGKTGKFQPGRGLTYCVDEELKGLFAKLEAVTTEINKCPWVTKEAAINEVADKQNKVKSMLLLIKEEVGVEGAKEVLNRVMNLARQQTGVK